MPTALNRRTLEHLVVLELPFGDRFDDPVVEGRRLFAELLGTAMLVLVAAGGGVVDAVVAGSVSPNAAAVAPGLVVMALIYSTGAVGGAHFNPAVTISFAVRGNFPWFRVPGYVAMQLLGAVAAVLALRGLFGDVGDLGASHPGAGISSWQATAFEMLLTLGLVTVILGTASKRRISGPTQPLPSVPTSRWPASGPARSREHR